VIAPASVKASVNYTIDNEIPPNYYFYEPEPGEEFALNPAGTDDHEVNIHNGLLDSIPSDLNRQGFKLSPFTDTFDQFDDEQAVTSTFYDQIIAFVKAQTGAERVHVFDHTIRRRMPDVYDLSTQTTLQRPAVKQVHCDYTHESGPQRVRDLLPEEADELLGRRVAFFNIWKPLCDKVEELPLAMCDAGSYDPDDLLVMELKYREREGRIYVLRYNPEHRWVYFPDMTRQQALIFKTYESETDGRARFVGHTAFEDPNTPDNPIPRESIEVRTMAFF